LPGTREGGPAAGPETLELLRLYVDRFNRRDWDGVGELASADARLRVGNCFAERLTDSTYFVEYERPIIPRRMAPGTIDGEAVVIILQDDASPAAPLSVIRLGVANNRIVRITDYIKSSWILNTAQSVVIGQA
jgi:RNA polymerase sigma-70 factor (ECF subfamily)